MITHVCLHFSLWIYSRYCSVWDWFHVISISKFQCLSKVYFKDILKLFYFSDENLVAEEVHSISRVNIWRVSCMWWDSERFVNKTCGFFFWWKEKYHFWSFLWMNLWGSFWLSQNRNLLLLGIDLFMLV